MHYKKYCEKLDLEIDELVLKESKGNNLSWEGQQQLHVLLENRKHIKQYKAEIAAQNGTAGSGVVVK